MLTKKKIKVYEGAREMENLILSLADRVLQGGAITCQEAEQLIDVSDDDTMLLLAMADRI